MTVKAGPQDGTERVHVAELGQIAEHPECIELSDWQVRTTTAR
jgi:hypothetical protein